MTSKKPQKAPAFEKSLQELDALVEKLETGQLPLEESLLCFQQGIELARHCQERLQAAEQQVQILIGADKNGKGFLTAPFLDEN